MLAKEFSKVLDVHSEKITIGSCTIRSNDGNLTIETAINWPLSAESLEIEFDLLVGFSKKAIKKVCKAYPEKEVMLCKESETIFILNIGKTRIMPSYRPHKYCGSDNISALPSKKITLLKSDITTITQANFGLMEQKVKNFVTDNAHFENGFAYVSNGHYGVRTEVSQKEKFMIPIEMLEKLAELEFEECEILYTPANLLAKIGNVSLSCYSKDKEKNFDFNDLFSFEKSDLLINRLELSQAFTQVAKFADICRFSYDGKNAFLSNLNEKDSDIYCTVKIDECLTDQEFEMGFSTAYFGLLQKFTKDALLELSLHPLQNCISITKNKQTLLVQGLRSAR